MGAYDDIINLPHHVSERHPQMPISDRAAQFSPFAALTGYEGQVKEGGGLTLLPPRSAKRGWCLCYSYGETQKTKSYRKKYSTY